MMTYTTRKVMTSTPNTQTPKIYHKFSLFSSLAVLCGVFSNETDDESIPICLKFKYYVHSISVVRLPLRSLTAGFSTKRANLAVLPVVDTYKIFLN